MLRSFHGRLTVKLRGRPEAPAHGAEGAQFLGARGAKQHTHHGPLQRLLAVTNAMPAIVGSSSQRYLEPLQALCTFHVVWAIGR